MTMINKFACMVSEVLGLIIGEYITMPTLKIMEERPFWYL